MAKKDFLKTKFVNKLMLFNVFDIDEFVLNVIEDIKKGNNGLNAFEVSSAKRYSYELCRVGENEMQKDEISTEDYLYRKENFDDTMYFYSELNYIDFEKEFPTEELYQWYGNEWLYDVHYNKYFFPEVKKWINVAEGDGSKKIRIRDIFNLLRRSNFALKNIETNWNEIKPIHEIQKAVIDIHINFTDLMIESIIKYYNYIFPNFLEIEKENEKEDKEDKKDKKLPIKRHSDYFKDNFYISFKIYTEKHIIEQYVDYSYLFQRMKFEKMIYEIKHKEFAKWLLENKFINEKTMEKINESGFRSLNKSESGQRMNNFNNLFGI
ncbi:hypothetical protein [Polaribacter sp. IC073]|uniref:hypothetical protein n=1 Tax=Polaribacter sp. IC073 TaxID=2508540 RepID=UPI0011BE5834|nr:hypothetical protein [Polaribacter sp. IC073]TXD49200.1 hypothetical protein ES045_03800 [Polaribacter sp. IC073]